jgi:hypothetical protein
MNHLKIFKKAEEIRLASIGHIPGAGNPALVEAMGGPTVDEIKYNWMKLAPDWNPTFKLNTPNTNVEEQANEGTILSSVCEVNPNKEDDLTVQASELDEESNVYRPKENKIERKIIKP